MAKDGLAAYEAVGDKLAKSDHATMGKMFGMPSMFVSGKVFAGYLEGDMVFKLSGHAHAKALAMKGAHLFEPMAGRPMKEWVVVPAVLSSDWPRLGKQALDYVAGGLRKK